MLRPSFQSPSIGMTIGPASISSVTPSSAMEASPSVKAAAKARPAASGKISRFASVIEAAECAGTHAGGCAAVSGRAASRMVE
jgi:hypothetical protein